MILIRTIRNVLLKIKERVNHVESQSKLLELFQLSLGLLQPDEAVIEEIPKK